MLRIEGFNPIPKKLRPVVYTTVALAGLAAAACGGKAAKGETIDNGGVKIEPVATATATEVPPTPKPTEAPKVLKTILDQPITVVTIDSLRSMADGLYNSNPKAFTDSDGSIYLKQNLDGNLRACEIGDPQDVGNAKLIAVDRLAGCGGVIRKMNTLYTRNGNDGLWQIAVSARSYFVTQYPDMKGALDTYLQQAGIR